MTLMEAIDNEEKSKSFVNDNLPHLGVAQYANSFQEFPSVSTINYIQFVTPEEQKSPVNASVTERL